MQDDRLEHEERYAGDNQGQATNLKIVLTNTNNIYGTFLLVRRLK